MEQITSIINATPSVALGMVLIGLGLILKPIPKIQNWTIPIILVVLGGAIYPLIGEFSPMVKAARFPVALLIVQGMGIGLASIGAFEGARTILDRVTGGPSPTPPPDKH